MSAALPTTIVIAGKDYRLMVPPGEEARIKALSARVDAMVAEMRQADPGIDRDRMLVLTCLQLAADMATAQEQTDTSSAAISRFHRQLADRLESLLNA
jgi:cell division protein ZapA (FtsZ GTPase activity inhibitor)